MKGVKAGVSVTAKERGGVVWVEFPLLAALPGVRHAVSTRVGGVSEAPYASMDFSFRVGDRADRVLENRGLFCGAAGFDAGKLTSVQQVHGDGIVCVATGDAGKGAQDDPVSEGDALLTNLPGIPLFVQTADCLPVLLADPVKKVVGVVHAGWKGAFLGIAAKTVAKMVSHYGCAPEDVRAAFGPCIGACCFEVESSLRETLRATEPWADEVFRGGFRGKLHLDLEELNFRQLVAAGLREENVVRPGICTIENLDLFYSHRAERGTTGRFASVIALK